MIIQREPQKPAPFCPVTLVLESQAEVDYISALVRSTPYEVDKAFGLSARRFSEGLKEHASAPCRQLNTASLR